MNKGYIKCECGQEFYFETIKVYINCIKCNKEYEVRDYIEDRSVMLPNSELLKEEV